MGILATTGTVNSGSYTLEIKKFYPEVNVFQQECPLWVPLIENNEHLSPGADYFIKKYADELMAHVPALIQYCLPAHYPLLMEKLRVHLPDTVKIIAQGDIVAESLLKYMQNHPEIDSRCSKQGHLSFYTTDDCADFDRHGGHFWCKVKSERVFL